MKSVVLCSNCLASLLPIMEARAGWKKGFEFKGFSWT